MKKMKVLITDNVAKEGIEILEREGDVKTDSRPGIKKEDLAAIIGRYDAIVTRSGTAITADLMEKPGRLKIIGRAGVGLDNVDIEAASKKGIIVMNAPTGNALAATELTMGIMLAAARKIPLANDSIKAGIWDRPGIIGRVGTILGEHRVNIASLVLSRHRTGEELAFVSVDSPIMTPVLDRILAIDGMIEAKVIEL